MKILIEKIKRKSSLYFSRLWEWKKYLFRNQQAIKKNGIVFISHDFEKAGAQVLLLHIVKNMTKKNVPIVVVSSSIGPLTDEFQAVCPTFILKGSKLVKFINKLKIEYGYDYVITNTVVTGKYVKALSQHNIRIVSLVHEMNQLIAERGLMQECIDISRYSCYIVFPSDYVRKSFEQSIGLALSDERVSIMHQGLYNLDLRDISKEDAFSELINAYGVDIRKKKIVINVATACLRKGFDIFLDMVNQSLSDKDDVQFIWVGNGYEDILREKLQQYNRIEFTNLLLTGYVSDMNILNDIYLVADFLCLTSREEPFGSIVLEAFKAGTPVIAFEGCGGYMDILLTNENGYLVKPYQYKEMLKIVNSTDLNEWNRLSKNCYYEAQKHNFDDYCNSMIALTGWIGEVENE